MQKTQANHIIPMWFFLFVYEVLQGKISKIRFV
ncbi:hypothetical protein [Paenibacillus kandeliae]